MTSISPPLAGPYAVNAAKWKTAFNITGYLYPDSTVNQEVLDELRRLIDNPDQPERLRRQAGLLIASLD